MTRAIWTAAGMGLLGVTSALYGGERGLFGTVPARRTAPGEVTVPRPPFHANRSPARDTARPAMPAAVPAHQAHEQRPSYGGYAAFRPYNYRHVLPQTAVAGQWGLAPHQAYTHEYRQLRPQRENAPPRVLESAPAPPAAPGRNAADASPPMQKPETSSPEARPDDRAPPLPLPGNAAPRADDSPAATAASAGPEFWHDYDAERGERVRQWAMRQRADRVQSAPSPPRPLQRPASAPARLQPGTIEPVE